MPHAAPCSDAITAPANPSGHRRSLSDPAKSSSCEQPMLTLFLSGGDSSTTADSKASTARSSATKARIYRPSLSDRLTASLITAGLVCGITPTSIRQLSGQPIRALAFDTLDGSAAVAPNQAFSFSNGDT